MKRSALLWLVALLCCWSCERPAEEPPAESTRTPQPKAELNQKLDELESEIAAFEKSIGDTASPDIAPSNPKTGGGPLAITVNEPERAWTLERSQVKAALAAPQSLGSVPRLTAAFDVEGVQRGYIVEGVRTGSVFEQLGLRSGDHVIAINGAPLVSLQIAPLVELDTITVELMREGTSLILRYDLR